MSTAEATAVPPAGAADQPARSPGAIPAWLRLLRSELRLVFRRLRNLALLAVLPALPVLLGIALRLAPPPGGGGGAGASFFRPLAGHGGVLAVLPATPPIRLGRPLRGALG